MYFIEFNSIKLQNSKDNNSVKRFRLSKSQNNINSNKIDYLELPKINKLSKFRNVFPLLPIKNFNNSIMNENYHIENIPIIIPNYNKYRINNSTRHLNESEHKTFDDNINNFSHFNGNMKQNNYIEQEDKYLIENKLYKDKSLNIILRKIYKDRNGIESCRNLETDLHAINEKNNKIIFSIFNKADYPKNNYNFEIFDFKTKQKNKISNKDFSVNKEEEKSINIDIMKKLKEMNTKLKNRLDKIEEEQKNKQKDINYLMKKLNNFNNNKENTKENNLENNKIKLNNIKKKSKRKKVKPLGLYHRLAGGYQSQNFNVNRNMIIKNKDDN